MFQILDFILFGIMLVSGLLALARGFTRELLSLAAWGAGGAAAYFAVKQKPIMDLVAPHFDAARPQVPQIVVGAGAFILAFIVASIIGIKISDRVVDSSVGAFDRTLGFLYGLARGLVLVAVCYLFYGWLVPPEKQEDWVRNAVSLPAVRSVSGQILSHLPRDIRDTLANSSLIGSPEPATKPETNGVTTDQQKGLENLTQGVQQQ